MRRFVILLVLAAACAPIRYAYHPTAATAREDAPTTVDGHDAAGYRLARGSVDVATLGIVSMRSPGQPHARPEPMLRVRLTVHNGDEGVWSVDAADQEALVGDALYERPRFARADESDVAGAVLQAGETRALDLYYVLPARFEGRTPPSVRVDWRVRTPSQVVARQKSEFEAHLVPRPTVVMPPPDPRRLHRALDGARRQSRLTTMASGPTVAE